MKLNYALAVAVLAATTAHAGLVTGTNTVTNSAASAKLKIRKAITLTDQANLDFGGVVVTAVTGTVTLTPTNVLSSTGTSATFGTTTVGAFLVGGTKNAGITITPPAPISMPGPGGTPVAVTFTTSALPTTLDSSGAATFTVGGTATWPVNVVDGDYTATFSVTVSYN